MNYETAILDSPPIAPAQVRAVMDSVGNDVALAASALGVAEGDITKSLAVEGVAEGEMSDEGFTPAQRKMALNQIATMAVLGENDSIKLRAAQFIVERSTVSIADKFKAKHGLGVNNGIQFIMAVREAKERVRSKYA